MNTVNFIFLCLLAVKAVSSVGESRAANIVDLYNKKFDFFDSFISPHAIDGLLLSTNEVSSETVKSLRGAWIPYTSLQGEIISWCVEVINTVEELTPTLIQSEKNFTSKVHTELNAMKAYFDSIVTNGVKGKIIEDYTAIITFSGGIRRIKVTRGHTPDNILELLLPLLERSLSRDNVTENIPLTTLNDKVNYAKTIITEALSVIHNARNGNFVREDMVTKCNPILNMLATPRASLPQNLPPSPGIIPTNSDMGTPRASLPQNIPPSPRIIPTNSDMGTPRASLPQNTPPSPKIIPTNSDKLREYSANCGGFFLFTYTMCEAVLSKSTMERFQTLYRNEEAINELFDAIAHPSSQLECKDFMKSFIKNHYTSWGYEVPKMGNLQFLKISICLGRDSFATVTIIN